MMVVKKETKHPMAVLPTAEDFRRKSDREKLRRSKNIMIRAAIAAVALLVIGFFIITLIVRQRYGSLPNINVSTVSQDELARRLAVAVNQDIDQVIPQTILAIRHKLTAGDFDLLAVPDTRSVKPGAAATYTLHVIRTDAMKDAVTMSVQGLPKGTAVTWSPEVVPATTSQTGLVVSVGEQTPVGQYAITVTATTTAAIKHTSLNLIVSNFAASKIQAEKVKPMDQGTKWQSTITWSTNVAANSWVEYTPQQSFIDERQAYAYTTTSSESAPQHSLTLYYLEPETVYHFRIKSVDASNSILVSQDQFFVTKRSL